MTEIPVVSAPESMGLPSPALVVLPAGLPLIFHDPRAIGLDAAWVKRLIAWTGPRPTTAEGWLFLYLGLRARASEPPVAINIPPDAEYVECPVERIKRGEIIRYGNGDVIQVKRVRRAGGFILVTDQNDHTDTWEPGEIFERVPLTEILKAL